MELEEGILLKRCEKWLLHWCRSLWSWKSCMSFLRRARLPHGPTCHNLLINIKLYIFVVFLNVVLFTSGSGYITRLPFMKRKSHLSFHCLERFWSKCTLQRTDHINAGWSEVHSRVFEHYWRNKVIIRLILKGLLIDQWVSLKW